MIDPVLMDIRDDEDEEKEVELNGIKGHIDCKINGEVVDSAVNTSDLDASTYTPNTAQDTVVDAGLYINVES